MDGKEVGQSRQLLQHVKQMVRQHSGRRLRPRKVVSDFESSIIVAVQTATSGNSGHMLFPFHTKTLV